VRRATADEGELSLAGEIRLPASDARFHRRIVRRGRCERGSGDIEQRAGVDQSGAIIASECQQWEASRGGRPGYSDPGNVITGVLVGYEPESIEPRPAAEPKAKLHNRSNAVPSYLAGCVGDSCAGTGSVRSERVIMRTVAGPFFTGPLHSPLRLQNTFAHEGFMDEICTQVKVDPVAF
jgi:hypothetical protein